MCGEGGRERESAAQPQARLTAAELGAARCRQTRLLLSSFIPRERYLCAERRSVHVDTDKVSRHLPFPFGPSFPGAEVLVAAGVEGGPGVGVGLTGCPG